MKEIVIIALLVSLVASPSAQAGGVDEIRVGALAQGVGGYSPDKEQGVGINFEVLFNAPVFLRVIGAPRPHIGASVGTDSDATSQIYAGLEWKVHLAGKLFVAGAIGGAVHNGEADPFDPAVDILRLNNTQFLGCRALFRLGADIGYDLTDHVSASAHLTHISNAGLCVDNEGLDNIGLRLGYRF